MRSIDESIKELKDQIAKLDQLILMGETFIHLVNSAFGKCTLDELPPDIQEDYISIMKDIAESQALKRDLEIMLQAVERILNRKSVYGFVEDEYEDEGDDEGDDEDE